MRGLAGDVQMSQGQEAGAAQGQAGTEQKPAAPPAKQDQGLTNYEATLGQFLGGKLYKVVSKQVELGRVAKHADRVLETAIDGVVGQLGKLDADGFQDGDLDTIGQAIHAAIGPEVEAFMTSGAGAELTGAVQDWVDAHPKTIAGLAILAAVGAVLADMDIPTLNAKFKLSDNVTAKVQARLGTFQNIALEKLKVQIEGNFNLGGAKLTAELTHEHNPVDGDLSQLRLSMESRDGTLAGGVAAGRDQQGMDYRAFIRQQSEDGRWGTELSAGHHTERGTEAALKFFLKF